MSIRDKVNRFARQMRWKFFRRDYCGRTWECDPVWIDLKGPMFMGHANSAFSDAPYAHQAYVDLYLLLGFRVTCDGMFTMSRWAFRRLMSRRGFVRMGLAKKSIFERYGALGVV